MGRLPVGYTELEYIRSDGTQFVNTKVMPSSETRLKVTFKTQSTVGAICACDSGWTNNGFGIWVHAASFGSRVIQNIALYGEKTSVILDSSGLYKDGALMWAAAGVFTSNQELTLFCLNRNGRKIEFIDSIDIYECIIDTNGTVERSYIPAKDPMGLIGLYDIAEKKFVTSETGNPFLPGPEVEVSIPSPLNLRYRNIDRKIFLQWDPVSDATEYAVYKNDNLAAVVSDPQYDDPDEFNASFEYSVIARSPDGSSEPSKVFVYGIISPKLLRKNVFSGEPIRIDFQISGIPFIFQFPFLNNSLTEKKIIFSKRE